jgi:hypothetical protein
MLQSAWILCCRPSPTGHTPHPTMTGNPRSRHSARGVNDLDRDASAFFCSMQTYLTTQLAISIVLYSTRPDGSRRLNRSKYVDPFRDIISMHCTLNPYWARFTVRHQSFRNDEPVKRCRLYMHGSPVSCVGSMQVLTTAQTDMACQRSSRIIYSRSSKLCLMIKERSRIFGSHGSLGLV